jgi:putative phosphoribosyl transferase
MEWEGEERFVRVPAPGAALEGDLVMPEEARGIVLFAHGGGSGRHSVRNRRVARVLNDANLATLLIGLLSDEEEDVDVLTAHLRFDIGLLARRVTAAADWLSLNPDTRHLRLGLFGAGTGAAAALVAAAERPEAVDAIVSRGGRPGLAGGALERVRAPTLLIAGGNDEVGVELNRAAFARLPGEKAMAVVPGASHLFEEAGALEEVARLAREWFAPRLAPEKP